MREIRSQGSVRGVPGNQHSYRDILIRDAEKSIFCWRSSAALAAAHNEL